MTQHIEQAIKKIYKHYRNGNSYYQIPEHWFSKMTLEQLVASGKTLSSLKSILGYNANLFLKTFDVVLS